MYYNLKFFLFKLLSCFPGRIGDSLYHFLQRIASKYNLDFKISSGRNSYLVLKQLLRENKINITGRKVIEIGSGWLPVLPYFLIFEEGVKKVYSYDLNEHFYKADIEELNRLMRNQYNFDLIPVYNSKYALPKEIEYYPKTDMNKIDLPEAKLVFSRFVLEHVPPGNIEEMHLKFKRELPENSYIIHLISPSDHRAYDYPALSLQDFLRYSEGKWGRKTTRFNYHNRLRLPQYLEIFKNTSLKIIHLDFNVPKSGSEAHKKFKEVELHPDFEGFTEEELLAGSINIILKT